MKNPLSLSVRIAEGFLSKEEAILDLPQVCQVALEAGFDALCMRASQVGIHSAPDKIQTARQVIRNHNLPVTMLTGDFDIVYNNERGPNCLRGIKPYLELAESLNTPLIRVAIKTDDDIAATQYAADEAAERNLTLVHQCHTLSRFETLDSCVETARRIDRSNFGIIYEPANLEICAQPYLGEAIQRLLPWIKNVYLQNQVLRSDGAITLDTWCRGPVSFDLIPVHQSGGIDFPAVLHELQRAGYDGPITVHQSAQPGETPLDSARGSGRFLRELMTTGSAASE